MAGKRRLPVLKCKDDALHHMVQIYKQGRREEITDIHMNRLIGALQQISGLMRDTDADRRIAELEETVTRLTAVLDAGPRKVA